MSEKIDEPLDRLTIHMSLHHDVYRVYFCALEVGRTFTPEQVFEEVEKRQAKLPESSPKRLYSYTVENHLKMLRMVGILVREGDGYSVSDESLEVTLQGLWQGCTDEELASAPKWLRDLLPKVDGDE